MKTQIRPRSTALTLALSTLVALGIPIPASTDEARSLPTNGLPHVLISAHQAILDDAATESLAGAWVFGGVGSDRLTFIDFEADRSDGKMAAVLTTSQVLLTISALEHRHGMRTFPAPTGAVAATTGQHLKIPLDKVQRIFDATAASRIAESIGLHEDDFAVNWERLTEAEKRRIQGL